MRSRRAQVSVITGADESPQAQLHRRQIQYFSLMMLRVLCLIVAAVLVSLDVPYALVWVGILTVGMVLFPWMAVMVANDRPPRTSSRFTTRFRRTVGPGRARALTDVPDDEHGDVRPPTTPALGQRELPASAHRVIDPD